MLHRFAPALIKMDFSVIDVFSLPYMNRALLTIAVLSIAAGIVGVFVSFREMEFITDGLVHAVFPGLVIGLIVGGSAGILPGAALAAIAAAILFTVTEQRGGSDAGIAVMLTGLFSLGVVLISRQGNYVSQLQEMLFGRVLTVTGDQLIQMVVVSAVAVALVLFTRRAQLYRAFDPAGASAAGIRPFATDATLSIAVALLVVAGVQALGVLMVIAIVIVPIAVARLLTRRLGWLAPIAITVSFMSGALGLWLSFDWSVRLDTSASPGAIIVLILVAAYVLAIVAQRARTAGRTVGRNGSGGIA